MAHAAVLALRRPIPGCLRTPQSGRTPLMLAAAGGHDKAVDALLQAPGIDASQRDNVGVGGELILATLHDWCVLTPAAWPARCPVAIQVGRTALMHAAASKSMTIVGKLLAVAGVDAAARDKVRHEGCWASSWHLSLADSRAHHLLLTPRCAAGRAYGTAARSCQRQFGSCAQTAVRWRGRSVCAGSGACTRLH